MRCNERIKFAAVLDRALALGFDAVCTGHYARLERDDDGTARLLRAVDAAKDQSYVLAVLTPTQLRHVAAAGESTKTDVRAEAAARGLAVAAKPDSHDICFIPDGDTRGWLARRLGEAPGRSSISRRRRCWATMTAPSVHDRATPRPGPFATGRRRSTRYVVALAPGSRTVFVGGVGRLDVTDIITGQVNWLAPSKPAMEVDGSGLSGLTVQVRAHGEPVPVDRVLPAVDDGLRVALQRPVRAVAAGQTLVLYAGDQVLAAGTIT